MITFAELTKQVHLIKELILTDMTCDDEDYTEEITSFSTHLLVTKYWFARISWANKKCYLRALLEDVRSVWTLSLLLKSIWNCRPKDAILSASSRNVFSTYDRVPMDHNRTALPLSSLAQVMRSDRRWFLLLDPEPQAMVLAELLTLAGGPIMWEVYRRAQAIYDKYLNLQLLNLQECVVINDPPLDKGTVAPPPEKGKKEQTPRRKSLSGDGPETSRHIAGEAQRQLELHLATWKATIKSMRDSLKLEELEMIFNDGTKKKVWKVNRPKPEAIETVDFLQLLPATIGKLILKYLPITQLSDCAKVNKYWAYLVDELRAECNARQKINADMEKLMETINHNDTNLELLESSDFPLVTIGSLVTGPVETSVWFRTPQHSEKRQSEKTDHISFKRFLNEKLSKKPYKLPQAQVPIKNIGELSERIVLRGATDDNIWEWCMNVLKTIKCTNVLELSKTYEDGILASGNLHFPCPMMKNYVELPLKEPLLKDPTYTSTEKLKRNISNATVVTVSKGEGVKRFSLWSRDFSSLYPVCKIPSYRSPI